MHRLIMLVAGVVALFLAAGAGAADKDDPKKDAAKNATRFLSQSPDEILKQLDKNRDGFLQKDELPPRIAERFDRFDKNGDGKLDRAEIEGMLTILRQRVGADDKNKTDDKKKTDDKTKKAGDAEVERYVVRMLETMDKNKDGKISKAEATGRLAEAFDRIDTNKDGFLDKEELRRTAARLLAMQVGGPGAGGRPATPRGPDFDNFDKDADGRLTRDEVKGTPIEALFAQMDLNKDGKVSKKEFEAYYRKQAEKVEEKKDEK